MSTTEAILLLYDRYLVHKSITTDSRNITPSTIFFALKGARFDGNAFAEQALEKGASYAVIDNIQYKKNDRYIYVNNVLLVLQKLAKYHRNRLKIPFIGITGSSGKTTTKELLQTVLRSRYITSVTKGNLNNHIGVPLTVLGTDEETEIAIVEMGANHVGEIAQLCEIAMPTHGLITNVSNVHIEGFGSLKGVMKGKGELYNYLYQNKGTVFVNSTDPILCNMSKHFSKAITYPQQQNFYHCKFVNESPTVVYQSNNGQTITSHLLGRYHFSNIAAALCVANYFKVDAKSANEAIQNYKPSNNRSQLIEKKKNTILLDAYNANLESTKGAIRSLHLIHSTYKGLILGDMAELGKESIKAHRELGHFISQEVYKVVLLCGPRMITVKKINPSALYFSKKVSLINYLKQRQFRDTAFLIKGSRFLQLETLLQYIN